MICAHQLATLACLEAALKCARDTIDATIASAGGSLKDDWADRLTNIHADIFLLLDDVNAAYAAHEAESN